jgi:hypothetical protein
MDSIELPADKTPSPPDSSNRSWVLGLLVVLIPFVSGVVFCNLLTGAVVLTRVFPHLADVDSFAALLGYALRVVLVTGGIGGTLVTLRTGSVDTPFLWLFFGASAVYLHSAHLPLSVFPIQLGVGLQFGGSLFGVNFVGIALLVWFTKRGSRLRLTSVCT